MTPAPVRAAPAVTPPVQIPAVDPAAAGRDAERLARAAAAAAGAAQDVGRTVPVQWYGRAADAERAVRADLARQAEQVERLAGAVAAVLADYAARVAPALAAMRRAGEDLEAGLRLQAADPASPAAAARIERAWADHAAAERRYTAAVLDATAALAEVEAETAALATGPAAHLRAGVEQFWQDAVVDPARLAWALTAGFVTDRDAWRDTVAGLRDGLLDTVRHPVRTLDEMLAGPYWRAGEWGAGVGALLAGALPWRFGTRLTPEERARWAPYLADPDAPRPRLQSLEELFAGVDLSAHEHHALGHTLRRHRLEADLLEDRLRYGTVYDEGYRGPPPASRRASSWSDAATAERWVGEALRRHEAEVREWAAGRGRRPLVVQVPADPDVGTVMTLVDGRPQLLAPSTVRVVLARDGDDVFILTAYPDTPLPTDRSRR